MERVLMGRFSEMLAEYKRMTSKECMGISGIKGEEPDILDNKIGGIPYWPVDMESELSEIEDMCLLLQVNLKDIDVKGLPKQGILEIFAEADGDWDSEVKVFIFDEDLEYCTDIEMPDLDDFFVTSPLKIALEKTNEYMPINLENANEIFCDLVNEYLGEEINDWTDELEYFAEESDESEEDWEVFEEFTQSDSSELAEGCTFANILGYPNYTQSNEGLYDNDTDVCLFKLDSLLDPSVNIGDAGILTIVMPKDKLENRDFSDIGVYCDCL